MLHQVTKTTPYQSLVAGVPKPKVGDMANCAIEAGLDNASVLKFVLWVCPGSGATLKCIGWYRCQLRKKKLNVPTSIEAREDRKTDFQDGIRVLEISNLLKAYEALGKAAPTGRELREVASMIFEIERNVHNVQPYVLTKAYSNGLRENSDIHNTTEQLEALGQSAYWLADNVNEIRTYA